MKSDRIESKGSTFNIPPELADDFSAGKKELKDRGLARQKAQICVLLDVSGSMQWANKFFLDNNGKNTVQEALNRILALSFTLDDNQQIDLIPFAEKAYDVMTINRSNYKDATHQVLKKIGNAGRLEAKNLLDNLKDGTNYAAAIRALRKHYFKDEGPRQKIYPTKALPVFAILITDGEHNREEDQAENQFKFSSYQNIFIKSFGLMGKPLSENEIQRKFKFLTDMDNAESSSVDKELKRINKKSSSCWSLFCGAEMDVDGPYQFCIDNSDFVPVVDPSEITMAQLINEFRGWLVDAHQARIAINPPNIDALFGDENRVSLRLNK